MTEIRFNLLMNDDSVKLTKAEIKQGWHYCCEFDGLLRQSKDEDYYIDGKLNTGFECDCLK